ncbi:MAG TPA: D-alanyl-D-alanine carboxypeptidase [Ktedonobacterales bacterium]
MKAGRLMRSLDSANATSNVSRRRPAFVLCLGIALTGLLLTLASCGIGGEVSLPDPTVTVPPPTPTPAVPSIPAPTLLLSSSDKGEAFLENFSTGQVYLADNAEHQMAMASTTKIMTAVVAMSYGKLDQQITVGSDASAAAIKKNCACDASVAGLAQGETLPLGELLYGLLLPSGDDAAVAIGDGVAGSSDHFVALMNLEATFLGLRNTHYVNANGLDADGHYTTAHDLAILTASAMNFPTFKQIVDTPSHTYGRHAWTNTNELLSGQPYAYTGAFGVKTGNTENAGYCLVFAAQRSQGTLVGVVLGEKGYFDRFTDAKKLLDWGFAIEAQQQGG